MTTMDEFRQKGLRVTHRSIWGSVIRQTCRKKKADILELYTSLQDQAIECPEAMLRIVGPELFLTLNLQNHSRVKSLFTPSA